MQPAFATGAFAATSSALEAGRYQLQAPCAGGKTFWQAWATVVTAVPQVLSNAAPARLPFT